VSKLAGGNDELSTIPVGNQFVQLLLELGLFVSLVRDVLDIFLEGKERCLKQLSKVEGIRVVRDLMLAHINDLLPVPVHNGFLGEGFDNTSNLVVITTYKHFHVLNFFFEFLEGIPLLELTWELLAVSVEVIDGFLHLVNLFLDVSPGYIFPLGDGVLDLGIERIKLVEQFDLLLGFNKGWILLMRKTE
jgi:hypothetical protein